MPRKPPPGATPGAKGPGPKPPAGAKAPVPKPPGATTRRVPTASPPPPSQVIIASSTGDEEEVSQVRQRVGAGTRAMKGVSLRWKIVIAMAGITVATGVLIYFVVYPKAVGQLDDEIDAKGVRIVKTLATIDLGYWRYVIYGDAERKGKVDTLLARLATGNPDEPSWDRRIKTNPELKAVYDQVINPLGEGLAPLKSSRKGDIGAGSDIVQITVIHARGNEGGSVQAVEGQSEKGLTKGDNRGTVGGVQIIDRKDHSSNQDVRHYAMAVDAGGGFQLKFNVILSLEKINAAKSSLRTTILLPIFVSGLLGIGIAIWISTLITEPIKVLMHDIEQVSSGNLDHQTTPVSSDEIGQLATTFGRMTEALRDAHHSEVEAKAIEHDLSIASEIQSNLVPKRMLKVPGYDIGAYYRPSKEVGGDYYDFIEINEDLEGLIVADVSGKGIPGSLVMSMARAFIRMEAERGHNTSPGDTLAKANRMLAQDIKKGMFVTALYAILNKKTNELTVASAGHNPMIVWRAASNTVELVNPNGIALGFDKGPVFERSVKEERLVLDHGDRIVMFTDGTVEAMNAKNEEFGDKPFEDLIQQLATRDSNQMLNLLIKSLDEHKGAAPQSDDITIVTLRYL